MSMTPTDTRPLRVMTVIARMNMGGPALIAAELTKRLDPIRFEHVLCTGEVEDDEGDFLALREHGVKARMIPGLGRSLRLGGDLRALLALRRAMRDFRPDIVNSHTSKAGTLGRLAAWSAGVPVTVHTFHGHHLHGYFKPAVTKALVLFERVLAWRTTRLVAIGEQVRDDLLRAGIGTRDKFDVVAPGVDTIPIERSAGRTTLGLDTHDFVIAFVGRLTQVKRPDRLVEVARAVCARRPAARFLVVGDGDLAETVKAAAADLDRVQFLGWRSDVDVVYGASDAVVLTSDNEGMPVTLIEAAMCGVPAVTTDVGSAGEVVRNGETGYVVERSAAAIAAALETLYDNPSIRARMAAAAAEYAHARFGAARMVHDIEEVYTAAIAAKRGRR